ncbi:hypothetical protein NliqN6_6400 [Naganishia liquefaciens]|uniref:Amidase domain-containing protein n=1 Tax=Naganishia liquefaciens TaxID=104408 RepID=A0A8H3TZL5_9TREE|nr:hypothetical protein NliqN6_6400 [Naganishia liquefaciens]
MTVEGIDLLTATIKDLRQLLLDEEVTSVQLITRYLDRIKRDNVKGLQLHAVIETAPEEKLLEIAQELDHMTAHANAPVGKLHGIPILVKDNIATAPELGMATTAGSYALVNSVPRHDATVIAKLRAAGAIILGKTNMSEFANLKSSSASMGWSARGGQTQSAYVVGGYTNGGEPLGSSSGSAVAVSAGWTPASLGTETLGSIIAPAGRAALYALRPTLGLVSRAGMVPACKAMDTVGPMAKCVYDVALLLECMMGPDHLDGSTADAMSYGSLDYTRFTLAPHATFEGMRLGVPRAFVYDADMCWGNDSARDPKIFAELNAAIEKMQGLGAIVFDPVDIPSAAEWHGSMHSMVPNEVAIIAHEFKEDLADYLGTMKTTEVRCIGDVIDYNTKHADLELPYGESSQDLLLGSETTTGRTAEIYIEALANHKRICAEEGIEKVMSSHKLDALIMPINALAAVYASGGGYPLATLPLGIQNNGEPFGFCLMGSRWGEPTLLALMAAFEANFPARAIPRQLQD